MKKIVIIIIGLVILGLVVLVLATPAEKDTPTTDITKETPESLSKILLIGKTSQEEVKTLLGTPRNKYKPVDCNPENYTDKYICDQSWRYEKKKDYLVYTSLDIYFTSNDIVSGFELKDNH